MCRAPARAHLPARVTRLPPVVRPVERAERLERADQCICACRAPLLPCAQSGADRLPHWRSAGAGEWAVAQLRLLFAHTFNGATTRYALVHYYQRDQTEPYAHNMSRVRLGELPGPHGPVPRYGVVKVADIMRPVLLQPDPRHASSWVWSYHVL